MDVLAGMYVCISHGVICCSPDSMQKWWSGAWYDLSSPFDGVAWRSSPISVVTAGNLVMISVCISLLEFLYRFCLLL